VASGDEFVGVALLDASQDAEFSLGERERWLGEFGQVR